MDKNFSAFHFLSLFLIVLLIISSNGIFSNADDYDEHQRKEFSLGGGSVDDYSRVGKEEKVAMNMAKEHLFARDIGHRPILPVQSSHGDSTQAASSGERWSAARRVLAEAETPAEKRLKIAVPGGNSHPEFVNVTSGPDGSYNSLVEQLAEKKFNAVVGDTAIIANRSKFAVFSQPYAEPGVQMVVYVKPRIAEGAWLFKKPFSTWMWAATGAIVLYNGFVVWLIERKHHPEFTRGTKLNQVGSVISLSFTTLFSQHGAKLHSNLSRMTMIVWLFVALIITSSYTASLTSLLAHRRLIPIPDVETLKRNGEKVGCDGNSFVLQYLVTVLHFDPKNIEPIFSENRYRQALTSGEIAAAFLEAPYVKLFLAKNCKNFTTGPTYSVGGFGFAFPKDSPYLPDFSQAILQLSEEGKLRELEESMLSPYNCSAKENNEDLDSLGLRSFQGLFFITVATSTIALFFFICRNVHRKLWCCWPPVVQPKPPNNHVDDINLHKAHADEQSSPSQSRTHEHWLSAWEMENRGLWP
ncbi:glutamate receptor 3.3-like [Citrus sinensis]|uniref:glutamate receptor 3.3-like n=1 Tax=Citrus sinensis TaxID=2711 RepID=UPI002277C32D|nr:glutamate receptor 3.3-like [Citrus sinensis]